MINHSKYPKLLIIFTLIITPLLLLGCLDSDMDKSKETSVEEPLNTDKDEAFDVGITIDKTSNNIYKLNILSQGDIAQRKLVSFSGVAVTCSGYQQISSENEFNISDYSLDDTVIFNGQRVSSLQSVSAGEEVTTATFRCNDGAKLISFNKATSVVFQGNKVYSGKQISKL